MIRLAVVADRGRIVAMAKRFHAAADLPFAFSSPMADAIIRASIDEAGRLALVYDVKGTAVGCLIAFASPYMLAPIVVAQEVMFWIEPEYRGADGATLMLRAYEEWARAQGCALAHMVGLGADPAPSDFYQRHGYRPAERHFIKPISA